MKLNIFNKETKEKVSEIKQSSLVTNDILFTCRSSESESGDFEDGDEYIETDCGNLILLKKSCIEKLKLNPKGSKYRVKHKGEYIYLKY